MAEDSNGASGFAEPDKINEMMSVVHTLKVVDNLRGKFEVIDGGTFDQAMLRRERPESADFDWSLVWSALWRPRCCDCSWQTHMQGYRSDSEGMLSDHHTATGHSKGQLIKYTKQG